MSVVTYSCPEHGDQGPFVGVMISIELSGDANQAPPFYRGGIDRKYCMQCWIRWMDAHLMPLQELVDGRPV